MNKTNKLIISILGVGVLVVAVLIMAQPNFKSQTKKTSPAAEVVFTPSSGTPTDTTKTPAVPPVDNPGVTAKQYRYKNGAYSTTGSYDSPAGMESMGVSIVLKNDIVVDTSITPMAGDGRSQRYQQVFANNYKTYVVGKNIDSINLDVISGSSLTPIGFNDALAQIKAKAQI
ncbi:MAG: calcium-binding protein [bacterium]